MKEIHIGEKITLKRKEKGVTQEQLANFLNVSVPAVSKWESGKSYPDLTLLPLLASYFKISIDELIGYVPYISKEEVKILYQQLCIQFTNEPFERVYQRIQAYCKKYYACHELQLQMGILLLNHLEFAPNRTEILNEITDIFERVSQEEGGDVIQKKLAIQMKGTCYMINNQPEKCIETLEPISDPLSSPDVILAEAYMMSGDIHKAKSIANAFVFQTANMFIGTGNLMFLLYQDNPEKLKQWSEIMLEFARITHLKTSHPAMLFQTYFCLAIAYVQLGDKQAIEYLEQAVQLFQKTFRMTENDVFECLDGFFERFQVENEPPRNKKMIQQSISMILNEQGPFSAFQDDIRLKQIKQSIENM